MKLVNDEKLHRDSQNSFVLPYTRLRNDHITGKKHYILNIP